MSSSERSSSGESDDESLPDLQKLKPYNLEPEILSLDGISTSFGFTFISRFDTFILCFYNSYAFKKFTFTNSLSSRKYIKVIN